jgi:hypothetical protein
VHVKTFAATRARLVALLAAFGLAGVLYAEASAQQDTLQSRLTLPSMPMQQAEAPPAPPPIRTTTIFPGITISSPPAIGAERGTVYLSVGYQERTRFNDNDDGAVTFGVGLWDAREYVGIELSATSYSTWDTGLFERVGFGAHVHRYLTDNTAIGIGAENLVMINGDDSDTDLGVYGVVTQFFPLKPDPAEPFSLITATFGVGNGRFRSEDDVFDDDETVGVFAAVSVHAIRAVALIADWYGQDLAVGASIAPFTRFPLVITPAVMDITENAGDGPRFAIAVGVGYRLVRGPIQF